MTDPIADMLTRIRNGIHAKKEVVEIPFSKLRLGILKILKKEGYVGSITETSDKSKSKILVTLRYDSQKEPVITSLQRVSRPGRRVYVNYQDVKPVLGGMGLSILSTSKGLMSNGDAKENKIGGELLCTVW